MSKFYGEQQRALQDAFGTRHLADRIEQLACRTEFDEETKRFIEAMDMFFLATVDHQGRPTVSYKGGDPGFVKVIDSTTLVFPSYDGNGMFLSMGNIAQSHQVGLLFISFERPHRIRVQGTASISRDDPLMAQYKEADMLVRVKLSELWQNCPRYVHRYRKEHPSRYVPREACETPLAGWKRMNLIQDVLSARDAAKAQAAGIIGIEEWSEKVKSGDPTARKGAASEREVKAMRECCAVLDGCTVTQRREGRTTASSSTAARERFWANTKRQSWAAAVEAGR